MGDAHDEQIDAFVDETRTLIGTELPKKDQWNTTASADNVRHYLNGIGDVNPRWQPDGPTDEVPPTFLTSVVYPLRLGAKVDVPLIALIGDVEYTWHGAVRVGDDLDGTITITDVTEKTGSGGRPLVFVTTETSYRDESTGEEVATAEGTIVRTPNATDEVAADRSIYEYSDAERANIAEALDEEIAYFEGDRDIVPLSDRSVGDEVPEIVRGPMTIADMVCWNAARGPSYGATLLNYREQKQAGHYSVEHPITGWIQKESHQHEDPYLSEQRGMALPFANGVMLYAWSTPLVTNWLADDGRLLEHSARFHNPHYYGDVLWFSGRITERSSHDNETELAIEWEGTNQRDEQILTGHSRVHVYRTRGKRG